MTDSRVATARKMPAWRRWLRRGFLLWAVVSTSWLANSVRTQGVDDAMLRSSTSVSVVDDDATLALLPRSAAGTTALIFICGSGIAADAYVPLLRPIAEAGHPVFVVKLPYRFAPLSSHKEATLERARHVMAAHPELSRWVVAGHSLGGALAARLAESDPGALTAMVLIGTTHPKDKDLSSIPIDVTKIYGSNDGIAPPDRVLANRELLPESTRWVPITGGNHSQFGRYGHQLFDGTATIGREEQEAATRAAILEALVGDAER